MIPHPLQGHDRVQVPAEPEPVASVPEPKTAPVPNRAGFVGLAGMAGAVALALFT